LAKKYECAREELGENGNPDVDFSLSTRELAQLIKHRISILNHCQKKISTSPLGESSGAAVIFGTTGGVIEAAVRTAYEIYTNKKLPRIDLKNYGGLDGIRQATIDFDGYYHIGIAHGLGNARKLLEDIQSGKSEFHAIEIMACPGGCIGGGGNHYTMAIRGSLKHVRKQFTGKMLRTLA